MSVKPRKQSLDRLSVLPIEILIGIISFLPLRLAIVTGSLSRRWRGLWTNVTSINIGRSEFEHFPEFMTHLTSPSIDRFIIESIRRVLPPMDSWIQQACDRKVRELKLAFPWDKDHPMPNLPSFIFQMQSLVSLELWSICSLQLPDCDLINLPNLKRLWVNHFPFNFELLAAIIKACPSLDDLILEFAYKYQAEIEVGHDIKISSQKLRRLNIDTGLIKGSRVVINAPKLERLRARTLKSVIFVLEEKPSALREVKINISENNEDLSKDDNKVMSEFYAAISNVRILTLDVFVLNNVPTVFYNVNRLAFNMKWYHDIEIVSSLIEMCPLLDVLTLNVSDISEERETILAKPGSKSTSRRVLKRIEVETVWYHTCKPGKSLERLVRYLLSGAIGLEQFYYRVDGPDYFRNEGLERRRGMEFDLCKLICECPMASSNLCEVEFEGIYHKYVSRSNQRPVESSIEKK